jgi:3-hydroxybutyryl-CoA dehydratase
MFKSLCACSAVLGQAAGGGVATGGSALAAVAAAAAFAARTRVRSSHSLAVGSKYSLNRTFEAADVEAFTALTGDTNPIHSSGSSSSSGGISSSSSSSPSSPPETGPPPIVPGILLASMFPAIIGSHFGGAVYATQSLAFRAPSAVGEPVCAEVVVARASGGRVRFETVCRAVRDGRTLVDGVALAIIKGDRPRG